MSDAAGPPPLPDSVDDEFVSVEVAMSQLARYTTDDLAEGVRVQPVESSETPSTRVCEGVLERGRGTGCALSIEYEWGPKFWTGALGIVRYLELVQHAVEARSAARGDVEMVDSDYSDENIVRLSYSIYVDETRLDRALAAALRVEREMLEAAEAVTAGIEDAFEAARKRLDGWGEQPLDALVDQMREGNAHEKGVRLEELTSRLFQQVPGFTATGRVHTSTEEIDIRVQNGSDDPTWRQETALLLVECKNWSTVCGRPEFSLFKDKLANRVGRVKCGFLVSWNGFADTVEKQMLRGSEGDTLIVPVTGEDLRAAVREGDFPARLKVLHREAVFL